MPLIARVTAVVVAHQPQATCFDCLAKLEGLPEADVRNAAQVAVVRNGLRVVFSSCQRCGRIDNGLIASDRS